jgi:hypothetical protein
MKKCSKCQDIKTSSEFSKHPYALDGLASRCKTCVIDQVKTYQRTAHGLIYKIYANQKSSSVIRNHTAPSYTVEEFEIWVLNQPNFKGLYSDWVSSGYDTDLCPSTDRLDDYKPYTFDNIRLTTWAVNRLKGHDDRRNGINNKVSKAVIQYSFDNYFIKEYNSISEASRATGANVGNIYRVCIGRFKTVSGYRWEFRQ